MISIIIPVYNTFDYLLRCLKSILNQSFNLFESIIVDDGSFDKSALFLDCSILTDDRIVIIHKKNSGVSKTRNYGISIASGNCLSFVDSDDYIHEDYLYNLVKLMHQANAEISSVSYNNSSSDNNCFCYSNEDALEDSIKNINIPSSVWGKLFNKNCVSIFDDSITNGEDLLFLIEAINKSHCIIHSNVNMYFYTERDNSAVHKYKMSMWSIIEAYIKISKIVHEDTCLATYLGSRGIYNALMVAQLAAENNAFNNILYSTLKKYLLINASSFKYLPLKYKIKYLVCVCSRWCYIWLVKLLKNKNTK